MKLIWSIIQQIRRSNRKNLNELKYSYTSISFGSFSSLTLNH